MDRLKISNFLTIREAEVEVKPFTVFIGPQANGKSVVAKLIYFFRSFLATDYVRIVQTKQSLEAAANAAFERLFPQYTWKDQKLKIVFSTDDIEIKLTRKPGNAKALLNVESSENLKDLLTKSKRYYTRACKEEETETRPRYPDAFIETLYECIWPSTIGHNFKGSVFIPASRSFFANLQNNVFPFLASNINIDPLIKDFGSIYQRLKPTFDRQPIRRTRERKLTELAEHVEKEVERIIAGKYVFKDDQDWIVANSRTINLANASSGQQEVLPMLLVLLNWVKTRGLGVRDTTFFIEEPEAHLFPVSQRRLVGIFSNIYAIYRSNFVLTTHSPYILTALNNLILASNISKSNSDGTKEKIDQILGADMPVSYNDVAAYTIQDGVLSSILDKKNKLIGASVIDSVSDEFDKVFDQLLELTLT